MRREPRGLFGQGFRPKAANVLTIAAVGFKETLAQLEQDADREIEELKEMSLGFQDDLKSVTGSL